MEMVDYVFIPIRILADKIKKQLKGSVLMKQKYLDMLIAIDEGIKEYAEATLYWREPNNIPPPQYTTGWRMHHGLERDDFFERVDWLAANGYITIGVGPKGGEWCDITDSYVETYAITDLGKERVERR